MCQYQIVSEANGKRCQKSCLPVPDSLKKIHEKTGQKGITKKQETSSGNCSRGSRIAVNIAPAKRKPCNICLS